MPALAGLCLDYQPLAEVEGFEPSCPSLDASLSRGAQLASLSHFQYPVLSQGFEPCLPSQFARSMFTGYYGMGCVPIHHIQFRDDSRTSLRFCHCTCGEIRTLTPFGHRVLNTTCLPFHHTGINSPCSFVDWTLCASHRDNTRASSWVNAQYWSPLSESNQLSSAYKAAASPAMLKGHGTKGRFSTYNPRTLWVRIQFELSLVLSYIFTPF